MISIKTPEQIEKITRAGKIAKQALNKALEVVEPGVKLSEIDKIVDDFIVNKGAKPGFKTVEGYDFATCININEGLVHGVPDDYKLKEGDLVSIDLGVFLDGWHSDLSYTVEVGTNKHKKFLEVGKNALKAGIEAFRTGNTLGDIGNAMQSIVEDTGYSVSRDLVGHGIGKNLHEDPYVPGYGVSGQGPKLKEGMVFAIEVIYQKGDPEMKIIDDDWTIVTKDGSLAGLFEETVVLTKNGPEILTK